METFSAERNLRLVPRRAAQSQLASSAAMLANDGFTNEKATAKWSSESWVVFVRLRLTRYHVLQTARYPTLTTYNVFPTATSSWWICAPKRWILRQQWKPIINPSTTTWGHFETVQVHRVRRQLYSIQTRKRHSCCWSSIVSGCWDSSP
jgi:hypothetical protein